MSQRATTTDLSTTPGGALPTRMLFVDDDENACRSAQRALRGVGFQIDVAATRTGALTAAGEASYGVVLVDYRMPDTDGFSLCDELRELQPLATFILISGDLSVDVACDAVNEHGIAYVLRKPWYLDEVVSILNRAVEQTWERHASRRIISNLLQHPSAPGTGARDAAALRHDPRIIGAKALVEALGSRDPSTREKSFRIAAYARRLAEALGVEPASCVDIEIAGLVHDIGMLAIPDAVLGKKGALTDDEWRLVRGHPQLGARLLSGLGDMDEVRRIVLQHHERWMGDGYPTGLRGNEISLGARILAVVAAFDALTAGRPHRDGVGYDMARAEIFRCQGSQFDGDVVAAFMAVPASAWREALEGGLQAAGVDGRAA